MPPTSRKNVNSVGVRYYSADDDAYIDWDGSVGISVEGVPVTSADPLPISVVDSTQYATIIDTTTTANTIYFGFVAIGSVGSTSSAIWRILRMVDSSGVLTFAFADGDTNFDNIWNNRASLSYS